MSKSSLALVTRKHHCYSLDKIETKTGIGLTNECDQLKLGSVTVSPSLYFKQYKGLTLFLGADGSVILAFLCSSAFSLLMNSSVR